MTSPNCASQAALKGWRTTMAFGEPDVHVMFPVPLVTVRLAGCEALNATLLSEIERRRQEEAGIERSNRYGWHSAVDLFERTEPGHAELARELDGVVAVATAKLIPDMPKGVTAQHEGWINVSPTHAMNAPHDHPGVFWSGCYYIHVPTLGDDQDKLSGAIEFI